MTLSDVKYIFKRQIEPGKVVWLFYWLENKDFMTMKKCLSNDLSGLLATVNNFQYVDTGRFPKFRVQDVEVEL